MDWDKVIKNLLAQSDFNVAQANEFSQLPGFSDVVKEHRACANIASMLAAAFKAGAISLDIPSQITPNQSSS